MRNEADTQAGGRNDSDTGVLRLAPGMLVQITAGDLRGMLGIFLERREGGKALVRVCEAVFVEIHEFWLIAAERK